MTTEVPAEIESPHHRGADHRMVVAIDGRGLLGNEVAIRVSVHIPQLRALAALEHDRKWLEENPGPGISAGQRVECRLIDLATFRIVIRVVRLRLI